MSKLVTGLLHIRPDVILLPNKSSFERMFKFSSVKKL